MNSHTSEYNNYVFYLLLLWVTPIFKEIQAKRQMKKKRKKIFCNNHLGIGTT